MTTAIITHRVADFDTWKPAYDGFGEARDEAGVTHDEVLRSADDPQLVIVRHDFPDRDAADRFFGRDDLRRAMAEGGVDPETVQIHLAEPA